MFKSKFIWLIILFLVTAGWWFWRDDATSHTAKKPPVLVRVISTQPHDIPITLKQVGTVVTSDSVAIRTRLDSQVVHVAFKDGDYVHQGDLLFVLDDRLLKTNLGQINANIDRDLATLENLKSQYERTKQLTHKEFESKAALDTAKAAYEAARADVTASKAEMDNIKAQLEYTRITAPISGRTGTINITTGNTVKANDPTPLVTINQVKPIRVQMSLPQKYLDTIRSAMKDGGVAVDAFRDGSKEPSRGTLEYIDNTIDSATGTFNARAIFPNDAETLWPGMFVELVITTGEEKNVMTVPEVAIQHGASGDAVFVIIDHKATKRPITVSRIQDSIAILESGLTSGEQVVIDGAMSLTEGSEVTIQADDQKTP